MPNKTVKTLTVDNVTYDIKDETARNALAGKQDKLTAGTNITIDETTNTISATGGADGESIKNQNIASSETKLYDWMGTLAEWTSQNVATTHPEWRCYITDDIIETHEAAYSHNVGDIFFTSRKDTDLNGAVECDGGTYNMDNYSGSGSIGELLKNNKVPYVSLSQYAALLTANSVVGVFGWDGGSNKNFRVPSLKNVFIEAGTTSELGNHVAPGLPNITSGNASVLSWYNDRISWNTEGSLTLTDTSSSNKYGSIPPMNPEGENGNWLNSSMAKLNAHTQSSIYGNSTTVQPKAIKLRAMVQLYNGTNDEAILTFNNRVDELEAKIGNINSILDTINGEVI